MIEDSQNWKRKSVIKSSILRESQKSPKKEKQVLNKPAELKAEKFNFKKIKKLCTQQSDFHLIAQEASIKIQKQLPSFSAYPEHFYLPEKIILKNQKFQAISQRLYYNRKRFVYYGDFNQNVTDMFYDIARYEPLYVQQNDVLSTINRSDWQWVNIFLISKHVLTENDQNEVLKKVKAIFYCTDSKEVRIEQKVYRFKNETTLSERGASTVEQAMNFNNRMTVACYPNISNIHNNSNQANISRKIMSWILLPENNQKYIELFQEILQHEDKFGEIIKAEYSLKDLKQEIEKGEIQKNYLCIKRYTNDSFFYQIINRSLRSIHDPEYMPFFKYPISVLYRQVNELWKLQVKQKHFKEKLMCYRGCWLTNQQIQEMKQSEGKYVQIQGFISTSQIKQECLRFGNCILLIKLRKMSEEVDKEDITGGFADIAKYSTHKFQMQILLNPLNYFKVGKCFKDEQDDKIYIELEMVEMTQQKNIAQNQSEKDFEAHCSYVRKYSGTISNQGELFYELGMNEKQYIYQIRKFQSIFEALSERKEFFFGDQLFQFTFDWIEQVFETRNDEYESLKDNFSFMKWTESEGELKNQLIALIYQQLSEANKNNTLLRARSAIWASDIAITNQFAIYDQQKEFYKLIHRRSKIYSERNQASTFLKERLKLIVQERFERIQQDQHEKKKIIQLSKQYAGSMNSSKELENQNLMQDLRSMLNTEGFFSPNSWKPAMILQTIFSHIMTGRTKMFMERAQGLFKEYKNGINLWARSHLGGFRAYNYYTLLKNFNEDLQSISIKKEDVLDILQRSIAVSSPNYLFLGKDILILYSVFCSISDHQQFQNTSKKILDKRCQVPCLNKDFQVHQNLNISKIHRMIGHSYESHSYDKSIFHKKKAFDICYQNYQRSSRNQYYYKICLTELLDDLLEITAYNENPAEKMQNFQIIQKIWKAVITTSNIFQKRFPLLYGYALHNKGEKVKGMNYALYSYELSKKQDDKARLYQATKILGIMHGQNGNLDSGIKFLQESRNLQKILFFPFDSLETVIVSYYLGLFYFKKKMWIQSADNFKQCINSFKKRSREDPSYLLEAYAYYIEIMLCSLKKYQIAKQTAKEAFSEFFKLELENNTVRAMSYIFKKLLIVCHIMKGDFQEEALIPLQEIRLRLHSFPVALKTSEHFICFASWFFQYEERKKHEQDSWFPRFQLKIFQNSSLFLKGLYIAYTCFDYNYAQTSLWLLKWLKKFTEDETIIPLFTLFRKYAQRSSQRKKVKIFKQAPYIFLFSAKHRNRAFSRKISCKNNKFIKKMINKKLKQKKENQINKEYKFSDSLALLPDA